LDLHAVDAADRSRADPWGRCPLASIGGIIWKAIFFTATAIWPEHNPFVDEHVIDAVVLAALFLANAGRYYGLGKVWQRTRLVRRYPVLA
jgi:thiosulfate dehydrogenase [quinone] large subunit